MWVSTLCVYFIYFLGESLYPMYLIHSRVTTRYFHIPTLSRFDCCCCLLSLLLLADCCWHCPNIATTFRQEQQEYLLGPVSESKWKFEIISKAFTTKHFVVLLVLLLENRSTETKAFMGDYTNSPGDLRAIIRIDISEWKCCCFKEGNQMVKCNTDFHYIFINLSPELQIFHLLSISLARIVGLV